ARWSPPFFPHPHSLMPWSGSGKRLTPATMGRSVSSAFLFSLRGLGSHFLGFGFGFLDRANHVECRFGQVVVFAIDNRAEAFDRVFKLHEHARRAGEDFGHMEGLR